MPRNSYLPDPDEVVAVAGKQSLAVSRPGQAGALRRLGAGSAGNLRPEVLHHVLALQVPDLDGGAGGGTQPVPAMSKVSGLPAQTEPVTNLLGEKTRALVISEFSRV